MKNTLLQVTILVCLTNCGGSSFEVMELIPQEEIHVIDDNIYFHDVKGILFSNDQIVIPCGDMVIVSNDHWELITLLNRTGEGPQEFENVLSANYANNRYYLFDNSSLSIKVYDEQNTFLDEITNVDMNRLMISSRFVVGSDDLIMPGLNMIYSYQLENGKIDTVMFVNSQMMYSVWEDKGKQIVVNHQLPNYTIIENGLKSDYEYGQQVPIISQTIANIDINNGGTFMLVSDSYFEEGRLYLLLATLTEEGYWANNVFVIDIDKPAEIDTQYKLRDRVYTSICLMNNKLIAASYSSESLQVYELKD